MSVFSPTIPGDIKNRTHGRPSGQMLLISSAQFGVIKSSKKLKIQTKILNMSISVLIFFFDY